MLQNGTTVLAIHGLNLDANDADFLILPQLIGTSRLADSQYMTTSTPRQDNLPGDVDFLVDDGSGRYLRVRPNNATLMLESSVLFDGMGFDDAVPTPAIDAHISARLGRYRPGNRVRVHERILAPGEEVIAIGPITACQDPTQGSIPFMCWTAAEDLRLAAPGQEAAGSVARTVVAAAILCLVGIGGMLAASYVAALL